jgi:hypothetical protein
MGIAGPVKTHTCTSSASGTAFSGRARVMSLYYVTNGAGNGPVVIRDGTSNAGSVLATIGLPGAANLTDQLTFHDDGLSATTGIFLDGSAGSIMVTYV